MQPHSKEVLTLILNSWIVLDLPYMASLSMEHWNILKKYRDFIWEPATNLLASLGGGTHTSCIIWTHSVFDNPISQKITKPTPGLSSTAPCYACIPCTTLNCSVMCWKFVFKKKQTWNSRLPCKVSDTWGEFSSLTWTSFSFSSLSTVLIWLFFDQYWLCLNKFMIV
jgi:hypothetical protein